MRAADTGPCRTWQPGALVPKSVGRPSDAAPRFRQPQGEFCPGTASTTRGQLARFRSGLFLTDAMNRTMGFPAPQPCGGGTPKFLGWSLSRESWTKQRPPRAQPWIRPGHRRLLPTQSRPQLNPKLRIRPSWDIANRDDISRSFRQTPPRRAKRHLPAGQDRRAPCWI